MRIRKFTRHDGNGQWSILAELALGLVILLAVGVLGIRPLGADE